MKALITKGCMTNHGGIVQEAESSFLVEGIPVHLEGMRHFCPKCKAMVSAQSSGRGFLQAAGRTIIMAGDKATCGASYMPNQSLVLRADGTGSGASDSSSAVSNFINSNSPVFDEQSVAEFHFAEGMLYFIETQEGKTFNGVIGTDGKLPRVTTEGQGSYQLFLGEAAIEKSQGDSDAS
ncbi:PAAR domain-containing protein [Acinetobacter proteolyticus]|uniref:PAAR domain-containing protein n=2 Tax=Acinetobacter proteolyticus TaxID=1776741 RepID=A0A2N0WI84_9GAMM|nr:PAAR domain-containing protein [Acinetobacter proteolyticus]